MNGKSTVNRVLLGPVLAALACGSAGCASLPSGFWLDPAGRGSFPARFDRDKPATDSSEPADATKDNEDERPSRWRQKLRAKYA